MPFIIGKGCMNSLDWNSKFTRQRIRRIAMLEPIDQGPHRNPCQGKSCALTANAVLRQGDVLCNQLFVPDALPNHITPSIPA